LPVVELVELESDWSPVDVLLSMLSVERPRRSIDGVNVEDEPERSFVLLDVEPVTDELVLALEPVLPALDVVEEVVGEFIEDAPEPDGLVDEPLKLPVELPVPEPLRPPVEDPLRLPVLLPTLADEEFGPEDAAAESGMQSM